MSNKETLMSNKETGGPAFPLSDAHNPDWADGMTLRDWFAGQALAGFCSDPASDESTAEEIASASWRIADAMIAKRNKRITEVTE